MLQRVRNLLTSCIEAGPYAQQLGCTCVILGISKLILNLNIRCVGGVAITRNCLRWILSPPLSHSRKHTLLEANATHLCVRVFLTRSGWRTPLGSLGTECGEVTDGRFNISGAQGGMPHNIYSEYISVLRIRRGALPRDVPRAPSNKCACRESNLGHKHGGLV